MSREIDEYRGSRHRMTLLLATSYLYGLSGSVTLMLSLVNALREQGCNLVVYARYVDQSLASELRVNNIIVTDDIESIKENYFDLAHVQHNTCLIDVRAVFPTLPVIFSSLGVLPFLEQPTQRNSTTDGFPA